MRGAHHRAEGPAPCPPKIQGFGITQQRSATSWNATGSVDDVGRLKAWGSTLIAALEALQALAAERTRAETCGRLLKRHAGAKADVDGVIAGLIVVLVQWGTLPDLADLETRLTRGVQAREVFCTQVSGSLDKTVRIWAAQMGQWLRTIRLPQRPGPVGQVYAVAMSPDGAIVAAGGYTREREAGPPEQIYLFQASTGALVRRLEGLPNIVTHLAFSPTGRYLAAALGGTDGLRVYDRDAGWREVAREAPYGDISLDVAFAADGMPRWMWPAPAPV